MGLTVLQLCCCINGFDSLAGILLCNMSPHDSVHKGRQEQPYQCQKTTPSPPSITLYDHYVSHVPTLHTSLPGAILLHQPKSSHICLLHCQCFGNQGVTWLPLYCGQGAPAAQTYWCPSPSSQTTSSLMLIAKWIIPTPTPWCCWLCYVNSIPINTFYKITPLVPMVEAVFLKWWMHQKNFLNCLGGRHCSYHHCCCRIGTSGCHFAFLVVVIVVAGLASTGAEFIIIGWFVCGRWALLPAAQEIIDPISYHQIQHIGCCIGHHPNISWFHLHQ